MALRTKQTATIILGFSLIGGVGCTSSANADKATPQISQTQPVKTADKPQAEPRSNDSKAADPAVQSELGRVERERREALLQDAQSALDETRNALAALDKGDSSAALAALARATGKLDLVVARDPKLAFAPVSVTTTINDLYATPETVKAVVSQAKDDLSSERVQHARYLVQDLASEADFHVAGLPLASYPAAIKAVVPLIDGGKTKDAQAALRAALNTIVVETYVVPLPKLRAEAMLAAADKLASKSDRKDDENRALNSLIESTRTQIQLAEALGYGTKDSYKPLYAQLDEVQKKTEGGKSGKGLLDKLRNSVKSFKFSS
jgi:hypothetical protein